MEPPVTADAAASTSPSSLRKRATALSVNTSSSAPSGASRERESKARQEMEPEDVERSGAGEEQPMSPAGRLFRETHFNCYIVALLGLGAPVDLAAARAGLEATLVRHPRFSSVQTVNDVLIGVTSAALSRYYFRKTAASSDDTSSHGHGWLPCWREDQLAFGDPQLSSLARRLPPRPSRQVTRATARGSRGVGLIFIEVDWLEGRD